MVGKFQKVTGIQLIDLITRFSLVGSRECSARLSRLLCNMSPFGNVMRHFSTVVSQMNTLIMWMRHLYPETPLTWLSSCSLTQRILSVTANTGYNSFHICFLFNNKPRVELKPFLVYKNCITTCTKTKNDVIK